MNLLSPALLTRLSRSSLAPRQALATTGVGERRSRSKGPGIEFTDHRSYQIGDDIRHLDRHVHARLGQHVIRQFALDRQMQVMILVDCSSSMAFGTPTKQRRAAELAGSLAFVALSGGDQVTVGAFAGSRIKWHPRRSSVRQAPGLFRWLETLEAAGVTDFRQAVKATMPRLLPDGLLIVISDWLADGIAEALGVWRAAGQELVGIQLLTPEELDPALLGSGPVRMRDSETGLLLDAALEPAVLERYRSELDDWLGRVRDLLYTNQGRYLQTRTDDDLERTLLRDWRSKGLLR
jgi:uncharacterized protein (DUF58 family)